jgi:hypothetical protein
LLVFLAQQESMAPALEAQQPESNLRLARWNSALASPALELEHLMLSHSGLARQALMHLKVDSAVVAGGCKCFC